MSCACVVSQKRNTYSLTLIVSSRVFSKLENCFSIYHYPERVVTMPLNENENQSVGLTVCRTVSYWKYGWNHELAVFFPKYCKRFVLITSKFCSMFITSCYKIVKMFYWEAHSWKTLSNFIIFCYFVFVVNVNDSDNNKFN